jgi:hypothetical protein
VKQATAIYDRIGVAWGRVHARIAQWLIEPNAASHQLQQARQIAQASSFAADVELIDKLHCDAQPNVMHPLVFV